MPPTVGSTPCADPGIFSAGFLPPPVFTFLPMKRLAPLFLAAGLGLAPVAAFPATAGDGTPAKEAGAAEAAKPAAKKLVLAKGVPAEAIIEAYGQPVKILPVETPDPTIKAERWLYRRKTGEHVSQEIMSERTEVYNLTRTGASGADAADIIKVSTPIMGNKRITTYQITSLLIVNGRLELATQSTADEETLQQ